MEQHLVSGGIILILIGFVLVFIGSLVGAQGRGEARWGVGGFIGPLPFGFASEKNMLYVVIGLSLAILILFVLLNFFR